MNDQKIWESLYSGNLDQLPWIRNPYPQSLFSKFINSIKGEKKVLDYGCGTGRFSKILLKHDCKVVCSDISKKALEMCEETSPKLICTQTESPKIFEEESFDGILCWGVLHHINPKYRREFWDHFFRILRSKGTILVGGWSLNDPEFLNKGSRISSVTNTETWEIDSDIQIVLDRNKFSKIDQGTYTFKEAYRKKERVFSYYLLEKDDLIS